MNKALSLKNILLMIAINFCFVGSSVWASDNVLQAIQVNGVNDTYNIILKSDDVAEIKKTIQAPNKMVINLTGIRASKTINTIYNNTSSVDSVVVEPTSDDSVKIMVQAQNVANAEIHFDSLKTPLGILGNSQAQTKPAGEIVLNDPMDSYKPVYDKTENEDDGFSFVGAAAPIASQLKNAIKNDKVSWMVTFGLFGLFMLSAIKLVKGKDSEIRVGLSQGLKEREIDLYRGINANNMVGEQLRAPVNVGEVAVPQNLTGTNYGLKAYQNGTRSPYISTETQRPRPIASSTPIANSTVNLQSKGVVRPVSPIAPQVPVQGFSTNTVQKTVQARPQAASVGGTKSKTTNIDSMKFLESMTKIYEKNGRADLAQGLKTNMKKAKASLA